MSERKQMEELIKLKTANADDAASNAELRAIFRSKKKKRKLRMEETASLGLGKGIIIDDANNQEVIASKLAFQNKKKTHSKARKKEKENFKRIRSSSIFNGCKTNSYQKPNSRETTRTFLSNKSVDKPPASISKSSATSDTSCVLMFSMYNSDTE